MKKKELMFTSSLYQPQIFLSVVFVVFVDGEDKILCVRFRFLSIFPFTELMSIFFII